MSMAKASNDERCQDLSVFRTDDCMNVMMFNFINENCMFLFLVRLFTQ